MHLVYFTDHVPNFGDDLNRDIWPALAPGLFAQDDPSRAFVGIGTIFGMPRIKAPRLEIFSTGAGNDPLSNWSDREITFHCVRGPITARLCGLDDDRALTDGAVLTPLVPAFPDKASGGGGTVVIPHYQTVAYGDWARTCAMAGMRFVDPRGTPQEVIAAIAGADHVLTESLHGAILADTYGVGWTAFATSRNFDVAKWIDWTSSLSIRFEMTMVPPPSAEFLLRVGKRPEPFGTTCRFGVEEGIAKFNVRMQKDRRNAARDAARAVLLNVPVLQRVLGFSEARTAEALRALAQRAPTCSAESLRGSLRERMLTRLFALEKSLVPA